MKKIIILTALVLTGALLLTGCAAGGTKETDLVYRGEITSISEDGSILVSQVAGHNYGQASILFHVSDKITKELGDTLVVGAYVEVHYDGRLTRSLPAQGTATSVSPARPFRSSISRTSNAVKMARFFSARAKTTCCL